MAIPGNPTHIFVDKTTVINVATQSFTERTPCAWWAIYNGSDTEIRVKSTAVNDATNSVPVAPGEYKVIGILFGQQNSYDLSEYGFFCTANAKTFTIEYKKA